MKSRILLVVFVSIIGQVGFAQEKQSDTSVYYKSLIPMDKQSRLSNFEIIANQQFAFRSDYTDGKYQDSRYKYEQFRLEMRGWVSEKVFFRFRHRYTSEFVPQSQDKIIKGIDMAYMNFKLGNSNKWELQAGKFCLDWGGIEFDLNPIDIYEYSDIIEMADNFMSGAGVRYNVNPKNYIGLQVYNSRTQTFDEIYGNDSIVRGAGIESAKAPLGAVVTWRGSLWDGLVSTLWSYSVTTEAQDIYKNYFAVGQQLNLKNLTIAYDFKYSMEDLDRTGIISQEIPRSDYGYVLKNTVYYSHWARIDWQFIPKWHVCFDGFIDYALWMDDEDPLKTTDNIRTAYTYIPTIEYHPFDDVNIKFFAGYVGRVFEYSDYAKFKINSVDYNTGRVMVGFISPLKLL